MRRYPPALLRPAHVRFLLAGAMGLALTMLTCALPAAEEPGVQISSVGVDENGIFNFLWDAQAGTIYRVQSRTNLAPDSPWTTEEPVKSSSAGPIRWMAPESLRDSKYYRVQNPTPEIFSVEPAVVEVGTAMDIYVIGQCFSSNDTIRIGGIAQTNREFLSASLIRVTLSIAAPGSYDVDLVSGSTGQTTAGPPRIFILLPSSGPTFLYEPPGTPAASPSVGAFGSKKGYDYYKKNKGNMGSVQSNPLYQDSGRMSSSAVHEFSGEVIERQVDLAIPGRGLDFIWARTYRSLSGPNTAMGNRWDFSYNIHCAQNGADMDVSDGDGRRDTYFLQGNGTFACHGFFREGTLSNQLFRLQFADGGSWEFNPLNGSIVAGKISRCADRNGNALAFGYDDLGRLATIVDTLNRTNRVAYTADGFIQSLTDFSGRAITYAYHQTGGADGSSGDLHTVNSPAVIGTPNTNNFPKGKSVTYTYSKSFADDRENHLLLTIADGRNQVTHRHVYQHNQTDLDFLRLRAVTLGDPKEILAFSYIRQIPAPSNSYAMMKCIVNDRVGNVMETLYDSRHRKVIHRDLAGRSTPGLPVTDTENRPAGKLRPCGLDGQLSCDPDYFETRYEWNNDSLCTREYLPGGRVVSKSYEREFHSSAPPRHKGNLRLVKETNPLYTGGTGGGTNPLYGEKERSMSYQHHPQFGSEGDVEFATRTVDWRKNETRSTYDTHGNVIIVSHHGRLLDGNDQPLSVDNFEYNQFGQHRAHILPANGSGSRRRDECIYYDSGPQAGYVRHRVADCVAVNFHLTNTFEYDAVGNVVRRIDPRGNDTLYTVNALNQTVRRQTPNTSFGTLVRYATDYYYDENNNLITEVCEGRNEFGLVDARPLAVTSWKYDILNCVTQKTERVDATHDVVTQYAYDANRNLTLVRSPEAVNGNDPFNVVQYHYDERDLLFREIRAPGSPAPSTQQYDYDSNGNLRRHKDWDEIDAFSRITRYTYDGFDRCSSVQDAMGNIVTNRFDPKGNVVSQKLVGETTDVPGSAQNVRLTEASYQYDALDRRIRRVDSFFDVLTQLPLGDGQNITQTFYANDGQVTRVVDDNGHQTLIAYDTMNRVSSVTDARGNSTTSTYDGNGNVLTQTETDKSDVGGADQVFDTTFHYDGLNRCRRQFDNVGNTNEFAYDSRDNPVSTIDPRGNEIVRAFDALGRCVSTTNYEGASRGITINTSHVEYNSNSRVLSEIDGNGHATHHGYDSLHRLVRSQFADGTVCTNGYDTHDLVVHAIDAAGNESSYSYDLLNRRVSRNVLPGPGVAGTTTFNSFQYDGSSRLVSARNDSATGTFAWDSQGSLRGETLNGVTTSSTHDGLGNRTSLAYPGGRALGFQFDSLDRCTNIVEDGLSLANFAFEGSGRLARRGVKNNIRSRYFYDGIAGTANAAGDFGWKQVSRIRHAFAGASPVIDERSFAWDRGQNKTVRAMVGAFVPGGSVLSQAFQYDAIDRLERATVVRGGVVNRDTTYVLDSLGNRTNVINLGSVDIYFMNPGSPPADFQMNQYSDTPLGAQQFDENGNLHATVGAAGQRSFQYDCDDHLVSLTDSVTGPVATYAYDALGRRVSKTVAGAKGLPPKTTLFFYDGASVIEEREGGVTTATYLWGPACGAGACGDGSSRSAGDRPPWECEDSCLSMRRGGLDYYLHEDDLGSIVALTDSNGRVLERYEYEDYGTPEFLNIDGLSLMTPTGLATESLAGNPFLFRGHRYDPESGFIVVADLDGDGLSELRHLDPKVGRYTSRGHVHGDPHVDQKDGTRTTFAQDNPWTLKEGKKGLNAVNVKLARMASNGRVIVQGWDPDKKKSFAQKLGSFAKGVAKVGLGVAANRTTDVTGEIDLPQGRDMVSLHAEWEPHRSPGLDSPELRSGLIAPIAMEKELRFASVGHGAFGVVFRGRCGPDVAVKLKSTITGIEMFRKILDRGEAGDMAALILKKEEGGRHTPFHNKYRPGRPVFGNFTFEGSGAVLRTRHDTVKNSIGNIR